MIPRIIHQTAKTADIPHEWAALRENTARLHPGWSLRLWTDEDNMSLIHEQVPHLERWYRALPLGIMRADVARCVFLYLHGGVYADLDYEFLRSFDLLDQQCVLPVEKDWLTDGGPTIGNAILASQPRHPFFRAVIDSFADGAPVDRESDVLETTGPAFLSRLVAASPELVQDVLFAPQKLFFPDYPKTAKDRARIIEDGVAYGIHHCHGTWRPWSFKTSVFRLVYRKPRVRH